MEHLRKYYLMCEMLNRPTEMVHNTCSICAKTGWLALYSSPCCLGIRLSASDSLGGSFAAIFFENLSYEFVSLLRIRAQGNTS